MLIPFNLQHVFGPGSSSRDNAYALRALLDCLITINQAFLEYHPKTKKLYQSGVVYGRTQEWENIPALYDRGFGDCKSLTAVLVAEYRQQGIAAEPVFRWITREDGTGTDYHILVKVGNRFEDPSRELGMGQNENAPILSGFGNLFRSRR